MPITMDGVPFSRSAAPRTAVARNVRRYSETYIPQRMPRGTASRAARESRMPVPASAFAIPPPTSPTGLGRWVKKARSRAGRPWLTTKKRIQPSGTRASSTASAQKADTAAEEARRLKEVRVGVPMSGSRHPPDQEPGERVDQHGDHEEHQADLHQRVQVEVVGGLRELVGDDGSHRVLRGEQGEGHLGAVANDHGDG